MKKTSQRLFFLKLLVLIIVQYVSKLVIHISDDIFQIEKDKYEITDGKNSLGLISFITSSTEIDNHFLPW